MRTAVVREIEALAGGHSELAEQLPAAAFDAKLPVRSNSIGAQFWCVVGARESYSRALEHGAWQGFSCSLDSNATGDKQQVERALAKSLREFGDLIAGLEWTEDRDRLLLALLEHEAQHQGQLIRYVYGLDLEFPQSWVTRWALEP